MKKTLTIVMALALAVSMLASFAFVLNPGNGNLVTTPTKSGLVITGFFVTDDAALVDSNRIYAPLTDNTQAAYAKNVIIRFAVTFDVLNPAVIANNVLKADDADLTVTSDTVDLTLSNYAGQVALHKPFNSNFVNAVTVVASDNTNKGVTATNNKLTTIIDVDENVVPSNSVISTDRFSVGTKFETSPVVNKYSYAIVFSGITKGEITQQGLAKLSVGLQAGDDFKDDNYVVIEKNGRTYVVVKVPYTSDGHPAINNDTTINPTYYKLTTVGYQVYLAVKDAEGKYDLTPVAQLDTESVTYFHASFGDLATNEVEVEGVGYSLGLERIDTATNLNDIADLTALTALTLPSVSAKKLVFRTVLSDGTVRYVDETGGTAFSAAQLTALNTMLADFGFSTADNYTYKLEDKYFTTAGQYADVLTATYNNGTIVPVETDEEEDLEEGTPEEELPEEEGDIEEEIDDEEEVPAETGDFASDIALALTAAAIVAAAALAFVMKKARD